MIKKLYTVAPTGNPAQPFDYYTSADMGSTWIKMQNNFPVSNLAQAALSIDSGGNIYLSKTSRTYPEKSPALYCSTDEGNTWKLTGLSTTNIYYCSEGPDKSILIGYQDVGVNYSSISFNKGGAWTNVATLFTGLDMPSISGLLMQRGDSGYYYYDGGSCYRLENHSFSFVKQSSLPIGVLGSYEIDKKLYVFGYTNYGAVGGYSSTDQGVTWDEITVPHPPTMISAVEKDSNDIFYLGFTPSLYRSSDKGISWEKIQTGIKNSRIISIKVPDNKSIILGTESDGIWHSTNAGISWNKWSSGSFDSVLDMTIYKGRCYAATAKGVISCALDDNKWNFELLANEQIRVAKLLNHSSGYLYAVVPNLGLWINDPSFVEVKSPQKTSRLQLVCCQSIHESTASLQFALPNLEHITISIYDILGHKLQTIAEDNYDTGEHQIPFSTSSLANGVYCIVLTTPIESVSAKVLVNH
ncbi:MAG TPA: hypothetical protein VFO76_05790 [Candidatus Kapabacteria bacterium]|nr:hypothetical protein [Candidatus Kapabacteria bacterium]